MVDDADLAAAQFDVVLAEAALQRGEADVAVHSTKDLPGDMPAGLAIGGYMPRADTRDVLVLRAGVPTPRTLATGSPRRRLQVQRLFPAVQFSEIRGNVDTRLRKLDEGEFDAIILAAAGLTRLGLAARITEYLDTELSLPAIGQGIVGIECRTDPALMDLLAPLNDATTRLCLDAERAGLGLLRLGLGEFFLAHERADFLGDFVAERLQVFDLLERVPTLLVELECLIDLGVIAAITRGEALLHQLRLLANPFDVNHGGRV